jgi:TPR repeat protein
MQLEELIRGLKEKADAAGISKAFPPMTPAQVEKCEKELGFMLPPLLKRVYTEVANGGIGPGEQLLGLCGGKASEGRLGDEEDVDALSAYQKFMSIDLVWEDFDHEDADVKWEWPQGVMPLCDWDECDLTVIDCNEKQSMMLQVNFEDQINYLQAYKQRTEGVFDFPGVPLEEWLKSWLDGTDKKHIPEMWGYQAPLEPARAADQLEDENHHQYQLRKKAEAGDAAAQRELASVYGYSDKPKESYYWYEKAADGGDFIAMMNMAHALQTGIHMKADWDRGFAYAKPLMEKKANVRIPTFYLDEKYDEVPYNTASCSQQFYDAWWSNALAWWEKRAKHGDAQAAYSLAMSYKIGRGGLNPDFEAAVKWCELAAHAGHVLSQETLGKWLLKEGRNIEGAADKAVDLLLKAADAGDVAAQYQLWQHYSIDGKDEKKALKYLKQAASAKAEAQNPTYARSAIMDLAEHYLKKEPDPDRAIKLLSRAAKQKYSRASYMLGMLYKEGALVPQNMAEAAKWFRHGMEFGGHAGCTYELGLCYEHGLGVSQDATRAERYFKIARDKNYELALAR